MAFGGLRLGRPQRHPRITRELLRRLIFRDSIIPQRINRRGSHRFDRARHRVFADCASRHSDRQEQAVHTKAQFEPPIRSTSQGGGASVCRRVEIALPFIDTLRVAGRPVLLFFERTRHSLHRHRTIFA